MSGTILFSRILYPTGMPLEFRSFAKARVWPSDELLSVRDRLQAMMDRPHVSRRSSWRAAAHQNNGLAIGTVDTAVDVLIGTA
jgi:hypothetical protein